MNGSPAKRLKIVLVVAAVTLVGGGVGAYFLYRGYTEEKELAGELRAQIDQSMVKRARIPGLERDVIKLRENVEEYVKILPNDREVNLLVHRIHDFGALAGVKVSKVKSKKDKTRTNQAFERVIYEVDLEGTFDEILKFANLFENFERFTNITRLDLTAGESQSEDAGSEPARHKTALEVETYVYRSQTAQHAPVTIPNYERKRAELLDEIASARHQIPIEHCTLTSNPLRRDPLVDPRRERSQEGGSGLPLDEQRSFLTWSKSTIEEVEALARLHEKTDMILRRLEIESQLRTRVRELNERVSRAVTERWITDQDLRRRFEKTIVPDTQRLLLKYGRAGESEVVTTQELQRIKDVMQDDFARGQYKQCMERFEMAQGRLQRSQLDAEGSSVVKQMEAIHSAAKTALDFDKLRIDISGRIVQASDSVVIINGKVLQEGEMVDDDLYVLRILEDGVEFRFRGVVLKRTL
ncbi:MAG: type 4a pilus biogenesis protein PilO [Planctomycetota bacterium]